jgi:hypothetical protein
MDSLNQQHEAAPLDELMDSETAAVMKERVASSTHEGYDGRNVSFMIWLFDTAAMDNTIIYLNQASFAKWSKLKIRIGKC